MTRLPRSYFGFSEQGRAPLEKLTLAPWASRRRQELLELLDRMNPTIEELSGSRSPTDDTGQETAQARHIGKSARPQISDANGKLLLSALVEKM